MAEKTGKYLMKHSVGYRPPGGGVPTLYGPGEAVEVPVAIAKALGLTPAKASQPRSAGGKQGGKKAAKPATPAGTPDAGTPGTPDAGGNDDTGDVYTVEELEAMTVEELAEVAKDNDIVVERGEGDGAPLKADYVNALKP